MRETNDRSILKDTKACANMLSYEDIQAILYMKRREETLEGYNFPEKPSSDGYYHIYVKDSSSKSGRKQMKAKTLEGLKDKVYKWEADEKGEPPKTFKVAFEASLEEKLAFVKDEEKRYSVQNTVAQNRKHYKRFFANTDFENKEIAAITAKDIEDICMYNLQRYDLTSLAMQTGLIPTLNFAFKYAYNNYWTAENVMGRVDMSKFRDMVRQLAPPEERMHTDEEVRMILERAKLECLIDPWKKIPFFALQFQIYAGLRKGELCALEITDIKDGYITITKQRLEMATGDVKRVTVHHTKNHHNRNFPITEQLAEFLNVYLPLRQQYYPDSPYLFPHLTKPMEPMQGSNVYYAYKKTCKALGLKKKGDPRKGLHSFRRNGITKVVNNTGGNMVLASAIYGNSPTVAAGHYFAGVDLETAKHVLETG